MTSGSPKNLRRRKTALQDTSVRNARLPKRAQTHSLKMKRRFYNSSDNLSVSSSCDKGTQSHPLRAAPAAIWMDSTSSASPEPHQQHTRPDFYNLHLLADTAAKVSDAESGKVPMETSQVSLESGNALQETNPPLYEGNSATDTHESTYKEESAMSKAEEQHENAHKRMKSSSPNTTVRNHPLFVQRSRLSILKQMQVQRCLDNRSALSRTCEGTHSHPLPADTAAIWMDSTTSATPEPHQQHTRPDFYNPHLLADTAAKVSEAESGKVPMETSQISLELGNTLQETKSQLYEGFLAMETHESGTSKEETAINEAEEQPQDANETMKSFSLKTTVCNLPLRLPPRTDGPKWQCPDLNLLLSRTADEDISSHLPAAAPFPSTADLDATLHRNPGGHTQLDAANSVNGMFDFASKSAGFQMYTSEPMSEATQYPCSAVQKRSTPSVTSTSVPICLSNPLQGVSLDEKPKARRRRRRRQQDARRESPQHPPPLLRTGYEATCNQLLPAAAPLPSLATQGLTPGVGHVQHHAGNSGHGMFSVAAQSAGLQMHASDPMLEATQYPCSAAQRSPAPPVSSTRLPVSNLQIQQAVAVLLASGVSMNKLAPFMLPQLSDKVTESPAKPAGDSLDESSVPQKGPQRMLGGNEYHLI